MRHVGETEQMTRRQDTTSIPTLGVKTAKKPKKKEGKNPTVSRYNSTGTNSFAVFGEDTFREITRVAGQSLQIQGVSS